MRPPTAPEAHPLAQGGYPLGPRGAPSPLGGRSEAAVALLLHAQTLRCRCLGQCQVYHSGLPLLTTRVLTAHQVYHSGLKLDDPLTKERTHDYLLFTSPRKVSRQS